MIDWIIVSNILEELSKKQMPKFDDDDEGIAWLIYETWKLAKESKEIK